MAANRSADAPALLLSSGQVARLLGVSLRTLWRMVKAGTLPSPVRYNRKLVRWKAAEVARYVESL
jgi:excisionase family DNA binding protein